MGSAYGCARGSTCGDDNKKHNKKNRTDDSCFAHTSCAECSLASRLCHWCAYDNACHVVGSPSGCLRGVNCYDTDHCMRAQPEALPDRTLHVTPLPVVIATVLALIICFCSTCCCCAVSFIKGAYSDLVRDLTSAAASRRQAGTVDTAEEVLLAEQPTLLEQPDSVQERETEAEEEEEPREQNETDEEATGQASAIEVEERGEERPLLSDSQGDTNYVLLNDDVEERLGLPTRSIHRLYFGCVACYILSLLAAGGLAFGIVKYFPQKPEFSVCSDSVAWKSIIDSLLATKVAAEFELLVSFANPNALGVELEMCKGSFYHEDAFVGDFEIPATTIAANSISDLLIVTKLHPERWLAVKIGTEYYRGTLKLNVSAEATVRIPILMDYTFTQTVDGIVVDVNAEADRHLCACPTWSDARNHSTSILDVPEFMQAEVALL